MSVEETGATQLDDSLVSPEVAAEDRTTSLSWGRLVSHGGNDQFELTNEEMNVYLGRNPELCDVLVNCDQRVSGKHCRIFKHDSSIYLENLSGNSTFLRTVDRPNTFLTLDKRECSRRRLNSGDMITLLNPKRALADVVARSTFTFLRVGSETPPNRVVQDVEKDSSLKHTLSSTLQYDRVVSDFYDLQPQEELGRGQYGCVYKAINRQSGESWACKEIDTRRALFSCSTESILNEVQVLKGIQHPAIIAAEDIFLRRETLLIILPLCEGGDLFDRIVSKHPFGYPEHEASMVMARVVDAVDFLHERNIVHRDLKPENILLAGESDTDCLLSDFGLAKRDATCKTFCGTPAYFAPEVLATGSSSTSTVYGKEADCWSLGVLAYVLLSGSPAFPTESLEDAVKTASFTPMEGRRWEGVSESAKDFIASLLVVSPNGRLSAGQAKQHVWLSLGGSVRKRSLDSLAVEHEEEPEEPRLDLREKGVHGVGQPEKQPRQMAQQQDSETNWDSPAAFD